MGRGNGGEAIFDSDDDRLTFLGILEQVARQCGLLVLTYCLMGNHFHLLVETGVIRLGDVMRRVLCRYARHYNKKNRRLGYLFQSRFKAKLCLDEAYFVTALRYIHRNPVEAGLVKSPSEWSWSSYRQFVGRMRSTLVALERAFELLGDDRAAARKRYLALMEEKSDFVPSFGPSIAPARRTVVSAPSLDELAAMVPAECRIPGTDGKCRVRSRRVSRFRRQFASLAASHGYGGSVIARYLKVSPGAVSQYLSGTN